MKRIILLVCILSLFTGIQAFSQAGQATLTKSGAVVLNSDEPLKDHYVLNADLFNFESDQAAVEYFKSITTDHVVYRANRYDGTVNVHLQLKKEPNWTLEQWNAYLAEHKALVTETPHQTSK